MVSKSRANGRAGNPYRNQLLMSRKRNRYGIEVSSSANKLGSPPINLSMPYRIVNLRPLRAVSFCRAGCPNFGNLEVKTHDKRTKQRAAFEPLKLFYYICPRLTPCHQSAKDWIRNPKRQSKVAEVKLQISGRLDEHAKKALEELTFQFQKVQRA